MPGQVETLEHFTRGDHVRSKLARNIILRYWPKCGGQHLNRQFYRWWGLTSENHHLRCLRCASTYRRALTEMLLICRHGITRYLHIMEHALKPLRELEPAFHL